MEARQGSKIPSQLLISAFQFVVAVSGTGPVRCRSVKATIINREPPFFAQ
jgi:hypothetical protein